MYFKDSEYLMSDVQYKQTKFQNSQFKAYCCKGTCKKGNVVQGKQITIRFNFIATQNTMYENTGN